jgi:hypothetical protein
MNTVRVLLNEACWLDINGAPAEYSGVNYRAFITDYVNRLIAQDMFVVLTLFCVAEGSELPCTASDPLYVEPMPGPHSNTFWSSVATTFAFHDSPGSLYGSVIFDLYNEPHPDNGADSPAAWACWKNGGNCPGVSYPAAGMQQLLTTVRLAGARNVVLMGGVQYSNALSGFLANRPTDSVTLSGEPQNGASWHVYPDNPCITISCYDLNVKPVLAAAAVVSLESGAYNNGVCDPSWWTTTLNWMEAQRPYLGAIAWTWDTWGTACNDTSLITDYGTATPTTFGLIYKNWVATATH